MKPSGRAAAWWRAVRPHQWAKNTLLFVPMLTAFSFDNRAVLVKVVVAFVSFCLAASAGYILNDLQDVEHDRNHPTKRLRPFASGALPVHHGVIGAAALAVAGLGLATWTSPLLLGMLAAYLALSYFYSLVLKRYVVLDVLTLALLYTWRILAGAVAIGVFVSAWLLAFSAFMFLSLALVKRCAELVLVAGSGGVSTQGRDYRTADLSVLQPLGIGAALCAAVIFGLYIDTQEAQESYRSPMLLWLVVIGLVYWLGRLWIKTSRGEMRDDPLVYALRDRGSRTTVAVMIGTTVAARLLSHPMFG